MAKPAASDSDTNAQASREAPARAELQRTFSVRSSDGQDESDLVRVARRMGGHRQDWAWLLASPVAVLLNEAGSGKTIELQAQVDRIRASGQRAIFLRIERLCRLSLQESFESEEDHEVFRRWLGSREIATFFLDSVDEAKLPVDLDKNPLNAAIRKLELGVGRAWRRTRLVVSSRPSAWSAEVELAEIKRVQGRYERAGIVGAKGAPVARFVSLDPLDREDQARLAKFGNAPDGFLDALHEAGAADLAATPLELLDYVKAYRAALEATGNGAAVFRSLSDMLSSAIQRRLEEHGSGSARSRLNGDRARQGARRLASACVLGQQLSVRLPGSVGEGIDPVAALAGQGEGWSRADIEQLLATGLFTAAWEGAVRFHHRRSMERLAGEDFHAALSAGMPLVDFCRELTPEAFGVATVPPPFLASLGWLATLNPGFRTHLLRIAPQQLIDTGDPGALPVPTREAALRGHCARYGVLEHLGEWFDGAMLRRFADLALEPVCRELLRAEMPAEPKTLILHLVVAGELKGCTDVALELAADPTNPSYLRARAADVLGELGDEVQLRALLKIAERFRGPSNDPDGHARHERNSFRIACAVACFPKVATVGATLRMVARLERRDRSYASVQHDALRDVLVAFCPPNDLPHAVRWLRRLCWASDAREFGDTAFPRWTDLGWHLLPALQGLCARAVGERPDLCDDPQFQRDLDRLISAREVSGGALQRYGDDGPDAFAEAIGRAPLLRQVMFRRYLAGLETDKPIGAAIFLERLALEARPQARLRARIADLDWLMGDFETADDDIVAHAVAHALYPVILALPLIGRLPWVQRMRRAARRRGDTPSLTMSRHLMDPTFRWRLQVSHWFRFMRWRRLLHQLRERERALRLRAKLYVSRRRLATGRADGLAIRAIFTTLRTGNDMAAVRKAYGHAIADALEAAAEHFARNHPYRPLAKSRTFGDRLALLGWTLIASGQPDELVGLALEVAKSAISVALRDIQFEPWAQALADRHLASWRDIVAPSLAAELAVPFQPFQQRYAHILGVVSRQSEALRRAVAPDVIGGLKMSQGLSSQEIGDAAKVVLAAPNLYADLLALASKRTRDHLYAVEGAFAAPWLVIWMRLDPEDAWCTVRRFRDLCGSSADVLMAPLFAQSAMSLPLRHLPVPILAEVIVDNFRHVRIAEDDHQGGDVTARHNAQQARDAALDSLAQNTSDEARSALEALKAESVLQAYQHWLNRLIARQPQLAAAPRPWAVGTVVDFFKLWLKRPESLDELTGMVVRQLRSIITGLSTDEYDVRGMFRAALEAEVRAFLARELASRSQGWFGVTCEPVTAGEKRTDIRVEARSQSGDVVVVELKIASPSWKGDQLVAAIGDQLVARYLISRRVRQGVYLVLDLAQKRSWAMDDGATLDFAGLADRLHAEGARQRTLNPQVEALEVITLAVPIPPKRTRTKKPATPTTKKRTGRSKAA